MTEDMNRCPGCGAPFQSEDELRPGYVPSGAQERENIVCRRCYRITHYNEISKAVLDDDDFLRILHTVSQTEALVVKVIDIFDFNGSWLSGISRIVGGNPVLLVANKMDLLPKNVNQGKVINWIRQSASELGLKPVDVVLVSAKNGSGFDRLLQAVAAHRNRKNVYVVGAANTGKSTLINRLLRDYGESDLEITTSRLPGTTLNMIRIPLADGSDIIDTPGIINRNQISHYLSPGSLKTIMPDRTIKPKVYQLNEGQTLFLGGLGRIDFIRGERQPFVVYASNSLYIHRTKLDKADDFYEKHIGELLVPPAGEERNMLPAMVRQHFKITPGTPTDMVISGLGWIAFGQEGLLIDVYAPSGVGVFLRRRLV